MGQKNHQKARHKLAKQYEHIANQRKAFQIRTAHYLCDTAQTIYAEDLNFKGLAAGRLAKHCLDAGWGMFLNILKWVSYKRGCYFEKVNARGTSQLCPICEVEVSKDLSVRIHECPECKYQTNRDIASAQVVLKRGIAAAGHAVKKSVEQGEETKPAVKQKRLKLPSSSQRHTTS